MWVAKIGSGKRREKGEEGKCGKGKGIRREKRKGKGEEGKEREIGRGRRKGERRDEGVQGYLKFALHGDRENFRRSSPEIVQALTSPSRFVQFEEFPANNSGC
jgi:hypothetical protein